MKRISALKDTTSIKITNRFLFYWQRCSKVSKPRGEAVAHFNSLATPQKLKVQNYSWELFNGLCDLGCSFSQVAQIQARKLNTEEFEITKRVYEFFRNIFQPVLVLSYKMHLLLLLLQKKDVLNCDMSTNRLRESISRHGVAIVQLLKFKQIP